MPSLLDYGLQALGRARFPGAHRMTYALRAPHRIGARNAPFRTRFAGLSYEGSLDEHIDWEIFFFGCYAQAELDFLEQAARRIAPDGRLNFFDVGANVGQHSLWMSQRAAQVFAFEPSASAVAQMRGNLERNAIGNVRLFPIALGDERTTANLGSGLGHNAGSRSLLWSMSETDCESIEVHCGDELLSTENLPKIDLLKLDVEGFERNVIEGLASRLERDRPVIMMELIGPPDMKGGFASEAHLRSALYPDHVLYSLEGRRRARLAPFDWGVEEFVCLPAERTGDFSDLTGSAGDGG